MYNNRYYFLIFLILNLCNTIFSKECFGTNSNALEQYKIKLFNNDKKPIIDFNGDVCIKQMESTIDFVSINGPFNILNKEYVNESTWLTGYIYYNNGEQYKIDYSINLFATLLTINKICPTNELNNIISPSPTPTKPLTNDDDDPFECLSTNGPYNGIVDIFTQKFQKTVTYKGKFCREDNKIINEQYYTFKDPITITDKNTPKRQWLNGWMKYQKNGSSITSKYIIQVFIINSNSLKIRY